jgi:hypothetical protein
MFRPALVVALAVGLLAAACGRGDSLGSEEAVEILVLDGIERRRAECIVTSLDGALDLEKVTGLDTDLDDSELVLLSEASASCVSAIPDTGGVTGEAPAEDLLLTEPLVDIEAVVADLVVGGVDAEVAACVGELVTAAVDQFSAAGDEGFLANSLLTCEAELSAPSR